MKSALSARILCGGLVVVLSLFLTLDPRRGNAQLQHNPGQNCQNCHSTFQVAGTIFSDEGATQGEEGVAVGLIAEDGSEFALGVTNASGNLALTSVPVGRFLMRMGSIASRTWHRLPEQGGCNSCHLENGNLSAERSRQFPMLHTRILQDNSCTHCHHFPAGMSYQQLATTGVLAVAPPPDLPSSQVEINGEIYPFDPAEQQITSVRADIFAPGYFSMFDAILAVAQANGITVEYHYDDSRKTHFITRINGAAADYWYHFSYDAGTGRGREIGYRRANRWDELLWRPGVWIQVVTGEDLDEIKQEYLEEIDRENAEGHVIPLVQISANPGGYRANPLGSGRVAVQREFRNLKVSAHNTRSLGFPSPYAKPFQPGVVTALDVLYSLEDQGELDLVTSVFYTYFAKHYIESQYVVALGFPGVGTAHSSGLQGFVYTTENGSFNGLPNNADSKLHVTSDILVIHAPDFSRWRWLQLGDPYYESVEPSGGLPGERLCIPLPDGWSDLHTGVAVVNKGAASAAVNWSAYQDAGSLMTVIEPGENPSRTVITSKGQLARLVYQLFGGELGSPGGWLEILGDEPGMSGFYMVFDPALRVLDGVDVTDRRSSHFLLPELPMNQEVEIAMVNPDEAEKADVSIQLLNNSGQARGAAISIEIPARGSYAALVSELIAPAELIAGGYLEVRSSIPLAAREQFGVRDAFTAMLNGMDFAGGARKIYAPQFVFGGGYKTVVTLVNLESELTVVSLTWTDSSGATIGEAIEISLPGMGRAIVEDPGIFGATDAASGYLTATSATSISGSVRFGDPAEAHFQTALPMVTQGDTEVLYGQIAVDGTYFTGVAVININSVSVQITVDVFDSGGALVGSGTRTIPPGGRISELLDQIIPDLPWMSSGYFTVRADQPVVSFAVFGTQSLSALSAIPPQSSIR